MKSPNGHGISYRNKKLTDYDSLQGFGILPLLRTRESNIMPDNKINERLHRLRIIDELFAGNKEDPKTGGLRMTYSVDEIIEHVVKKGVIGYNRFKWARDLEFLKEDPHVEIIEETVSARGGTGRPLIKYGYDRNSPSLFQETLSTDDKKLIGDILDTLQLKGISTLASFVKFNINYGKDLKKRKSPIISFTRNPKDKDISKTLDKLLKFIRTETVIKIEMTDRFIETKLTVHIVHPWYLREYNRRWYLFGWEDGQIKHYALDRITKLSKRSMPNYKVPDKTIDQILEHVVGIIFKETDSVEEIVFWVSSKSSDFVSKKPIHHTMKILTKEEVRNKVDEKILGRLPKKKGVFYKMNCIINYELRREMMSFGRELIVLQPSELRNWLHGILKDMASSYED